MTFKASTQGDPARPPRSPSPWLFALLALSIVAVGEQLLERYAWREAVSRERVRVLERLGTLRARLEGQINSHLMLAQGLTAVVQHHPDVNQAEFARVGAEIDTRIGALRNIAAAPDMVISMIYPLEGNAAAIGLDYRTHPTQGPAAQRAMDTGQMVIAGPLPLVQGGEGVIARIPVYLSRSDAPSGRVPWGLVSAVMDVDRLYRNAGLTTLASQFQVAIRGRDGTGSEGAVFYGDGRVFDRQAVTLEVTLPSGSWQLAAVPLGGWGQVASRLPLIRLLGAIVAVAAATAAFALARAHVLARDTADRLRDSQELFQKFMHHLPAGAFVRDPASGGFDFCNHWFSDHFGAAGTAAAQRMLEDDRRTLREGKLRSNEVQSDGRGEPLYCDVQRFLIPRVGSHPLVGGVVNDISARVMAEQRLADSEARLNAAEAIAHVGHWAYRVSDGAIQWSDETYRIFGLTPQSETVTYEMLVALVHPDDRKYYDDYLQRMLASRPGEDIPENGFRLTRRDGTERSVVVWVRIEYDERGAPERLFGAVQDVTEHQRLEQRLRERLDELLLWHQVTLGREDRIRELKSEVNTLLADQGLAIRYLSQRESA